MSSTLNIPPVRPTPPQEAPISPGKRAFIGIGIMAILLLSYLFCAFSLLLVTAFLILDVVLVIPAVRFGMAGYFASALGKQAILARLLIRGLRLQDSPNLDIALEREEAPRLFELLEELAGKTGVAPPAEIRLIMDLNAAVKVRGYRSGRTGSSVIVGFDLIAACTVDQLRAILAHELAHAKLIQPGFNGWRVNAMRRISQVGMGVGDLDFSARSQKKTFYTATFVYKGLRALARAGSRLVAIHSRQHEFAADGLAVQVAGAAAFRDGLMRTHLAVLAMDDLSYRDRLIQSQREDSFTDWVVSRMRVQPEDEAKFTERVLSGKNEDPYDSHPSLSDRLQAIPEPESVASASMPATTLLTDPDAVVSRLLKEMERLLSDQEKKDNADLLEHARKRSPKPGINGEQAAVIFGQILVFGLLIFAIVAPIVDPANFDVMLSAILIGASLVGLWGLGYLYRLARRKETGYLPSPAYTLLAERLESGPFCKNSREAKEWHDAALTTVPGQYPVAAAGRQTAAKWWGGQCFQALGMADYRKAYACALRGLSIDPQQFEALATLPIVAAAIGNEEMATGALYQLFQKYGLGPSVSWCAGWTFALIGEWEPAEAYLHDAATRRPADPSVWALLAYCQSRRDKVRESVNSMRRANFLRRDDQAQQLLLAKILLDAGRPREVEQIMMGLPPSFTKSREGIIATIRLYLLMGHEDLAKGLAEGLIAQHPTGKSWLDVGRAYHEAKRLDLAEEVLRRGRAAGYYPGVLVSLALVLRKAEKKNEWKPILLEAIDMTRKPSEDATRPQDILPTVCSFLASDREPKKCTAWSLEIGVPGLGFETGKLVFLILATSNLEANALIREIWVAMNGPRVAPTPRLDWKRLPKDKQPDEPMSPGIYGIQEV